METHETIMSPSNSPATTVDPFTKVPDEIMAAIFEETVTEFENTFPIPPLLVHSLSIITLVSRRWYAVAIQAPRLWRTILIFSGGMCPKLCVERSGAVALNICGRAYSGALLTRCLSYGTVTERLESLDLSKLRKDELAFLQSREWPSLKKLSLTRCSIGSCNDLIKLLKQARGLQYISFQHVYFHGLSSTFQVVELPRLEAVELVDASEESTQLMLRGVRAPNARKLFIRLSGPLTDTASPYKVTSRAWDQLRDLSFGGLRLDPRQILNLLPHTPCAVSLRLFQIDTWTSDFDDFFHSLARIAADGTSTLVPHLRTLALYKIRFSFMALRLLVDSRRRSKTAIESIGFGRIRSEWYFDGDFTLLKEHVEMFEWKPCHAR